MGARNWMAACVAALTVFPAAARAATVTVERAIPDLTPTGAISITWQGEPALGCAPAGTCGVSGSIEVLAAPQTGASSGSPNTQVEIADPDAVARVTDVQAGGSSSSCVDLVPVDFAVNIIQRKGRALRTLIEPFPVQGPSSGRCAGPTSADLTGFELPVHRLPGRPEGYDLSGTRSLDAGSYLVTIVSTVRARRGSAGSAGSFGFGAAPGPPPGPPSGAPKPRSVLLEDVVVTYAAALAGSLTMTFSAGPAPGCTPLGACGSSGSLTGTIGQNGGRLRLEAQKVVPRALSRAAALAELRAGRMTLFPAAPIQVSLPASATTDAAGGAVCRDAHVLEPTLTGVPQRGALGFSLSLQGGDPLRSRCPGPATVDVLGAGDTIASGRLALRRLGDPRLSLQLSGAGSFAAPSYGGSRRAAMAADLRLVSISVHARRERGFFGLP